MNGLAEVEFLLGTQQQTQANNHYMAQNVNQCCAKMHYWKNTRPPPTQRRRRPYQLAQKGRFLRVLKQACKFRISKAAVLGHVLFQFSQKRQLAFVADVRKAGVPGLLLPTMPLTMLCLAYRLRKNTTRMQCTVNSPGHMPVFQKHVQTRKRFVAESVDTPCFYKFVVRISHVGLNEVCLLLLAALHSRSIASLLCPGMVSIPQISFNHNMPYAQRTVLASPLSIAMADPGLVPPSLLQSSLPMFMPTPKTVASTYARCTTRASHVKGRQNKARAKRSHWLRRR